MVLLFRNLRRLLKIMASQTFRPKYFIVPTIFSLINLLNYFLLPQKMKSLQKAATKNNLTFFFLKLKSFLIAFFSSISIKKLSLKIKESFFIARVFPYKKRREPNIIKHRKRGTKFLLIFYYFFCICH